MPAFHKSYSADKTDLYFQEKEVTNPRYTDSFVGTPADGTSVPKIRSFRDTLSRQGRFILHRRKSTKSTLHGKAVRHTRKRQLHSENSTPPAFPDPHSSHTTASYFNRRKHKNHVTQTASCAHLQASANGRSARKSRTSISSKANTSALHSSNVISPILSCRQRRTVPWHVTDPAASYALQLRTQSRRFTSVAHALWRR